MDYLLMQMSWRRSGAQQENKEEESGSVKDRSIPPQKRVSFKGESNKEEEAGKEEESGSVKDRSIPPNKSQSFKGESNKEEESGSVKDRSIPPQKRVSFKGDSDIEEEAGSVKDRSIPPKKSQSFKEKKKDQNWFWRQFLRQMSDDYSLDGKIEHAAAVAASAYAIDSLKESHNPNKKQTRQEHAAAVAASAYAIDSLKESHSPNKKQTRQEPAGTSLIPIKSRKEDTDSKQLSFYLSDQDSKRSSENLDSKVPITASGDSKTLEKAIVPAPSVKKTPSSSREKAIGPAPSMKKSSSFAPEKANLPAPSVKKPPSFVDKQSSNTGSTKRRSATPKLELPTAIKLPPPPSETNRQSLTSPGTVKSKADVWEESEIARINARYEKQQNTILSWEQNKLKKAKSQNHKTESNLDKKREKLLETFKDEMGRIDEIVRKERANAEEKLKKDTLKAKETAGEMAGEIRQTGKVPKTCYCC